MVLAAMIESIFTVMGKPKDSVRQCPLAMDKWNELVIGPFPSVDGKTHCALNCGTYSICHTSERPREARLQNYRHSKLVKSSSPVCIRNWLITLVSYTMRKPERVPEVLAQAKTSGSGSGGVKKIA